MWSDEAIRASRVQLSDPLKSDVLWMLDTVSLKNSNGSFGTILLENLFAKKYLIKDRRVSDKEYSYTSVDEIINDGWVLD